MEQRPKWSREEWLHPTSLFSCSHPLAREEAGLLLLGAQQC